MGAWGDDESGISRGERREFDLQRAVRRFMYPAVVAYFATILGVLFVIPKTATALDVIVGMLAIGFLLGVAFLGVAARTLEIQRADSFVGYNIQDGSKPLFAFGTREYTRYRIDDGTRGNLSRVYPPYRENLTARTQRQRELECAVCGNTIGLDGGYFVESRTIRRVFGIPVGETIRETDAYCAEHKPDEFQ